MTPRERWLCLFQGTRPDRVPSDYWGTGEITARLLRDLNCADEREMWERLEIDKCQYLAARHPRAREDTWHTPSLWSLFGVGVRLVAYGGGLGVYEEVVDSPLADAREPSDLEAIPWPDAEEWDYSSLRRQCLEWPDHPIVGAAYEPFYLYSRLRGMERALEDLSLNPEFVDAAMSRIHGLFEQIVRRSLEAAGGLFDYVYVAEDLGTQGSLLMSPRAFRRFVKPWLARMAEVAHSYGALVFHHDDGAIRPLIPDLLEIGIDILNPVQWRCKGMEREGLARDFGGRVVFHGGVDNQGTLPFGTPDEVRAEVRENLRLFSGGKGYIVAPCHNLQANTPTENVVAMYEAVREQP